MATLDDLKVGDIVLRQNNGGWYTSYDKLTVEKVGKVHITVGGEKYRINDGRGVGGGYSRSNILHFDAEVWTNYQQKLRDLRARRRLAEIRWDGIPTSTVHAICALLDAEVGPEPNKGVA